MILQELVMYYESLAEKGKIAKEGWCQAKVSYAIYLSKEGVVTGISSLKREEEQGKKKVWRPALMEVPEMVTRSSGISANFLCDNARYMLGIETGGKVSGKAGKYFQAAKEKHCLLLANVQGETAKAVRRFFETWNPEKAMECEEVKNAWEEITDGGNLIFSVGTEFAQENKEIREAWEKECASAEEGQQGICLVTGKYGQISRLHKAIKGVAGAQSSGAPLISFNEPSFESYGKEQSYNAPVSRYAEFAYTTALNYLLSQRKYIFQIGDTTILFWAESAEPEYQDFFSIAINPPDNQEEIKDFFLKLKKHEAIDIGNFRINPEQKFCILGLAPNAARLSVRFFYQDSFGMILRNILRHYEQMKIVKPSWETRQYLGIWAMLQETVNKKAKDKAPLSNMASMVLQAILSGRRYPASLYSDTLIRIRAEQGAVTWGRAAIIKAFLTRNCKKGENSMGLDTENNETPYVLGRLFAVLEFIQREANPNIKATIRDRYFNSACATPASVFPVLIKLKNSHIKKLERDRMGTKMSYEKKLSEIMEKLKLFPKRLSLEEQGEFVLGYYHQTQNFYEKKEDK